MAHSAKRIKRRASQKRKRKFYESTANIRSKGKTPDQIRKEFQDRTGKSHPQEGTFADDPFLRERQEAWIGNFYKRTEANHER